MTFLVIACNFSCIITRVARKEIVSGQRSRLWYVNGLVACGLIKESLLIASAIGHMFDGPYCVQWILSVVFRAAFERWAVAPARLSSLLARIELSRGRHPHFLRGYHLRAISLFVI